MTALNAQTVNAMKPGPARREIPDSVVPGLYLVVQPSGQKSWAVRYRFAGKPCKLTLGSFPQIPLAEKDDDRKARLARDPKSDATDARGLARAALGLVAAGRNPAIQKRLNASGVANADLVEKVWDEFKERHLDRNMKASSAERFKRIFENHILPKWKGRRIDEIAKRDILNVIDDATKRGPHAGNSAVTVCSIFFNWCLGRDVIATSPMAGVKKPTAESSRERTLSDDEIKTFWNGCTKLASVFGPMFELLLLTGARRNEVAEMAYSELDLANRLWIIPASRTKNGVEHRVYLSDAAIDLLKKIPRIDGSKFVFTTTGDSAVSGFSKAKTQLDKLTPDLAPYRLHDLRRTCASHMAKLGIALPVIEKCLNHTGGSFAGIVGVYQRHTFAEEMEKAFKAWGDYVTALVSGNGAKNVVPIRTKSRKLVKA